MTASKMDIRSLLSPQDIPAAEACPSSPDPPQPSRRKSQVKKREARGSSQNAAPSLAQSSIGKQAQYTPSPSLTTPSSLGTDRNYQSPHNGKLESRGPPIASPPSISPHGVHLQAATAMDTLADLASMQHDQRTARQSAASHRHIDLDDSCRSSSTMSTTPVLRKTSLATPEHPNADALVMPACFELRKPSLVPSEHPMADALVPTISPRRFASSAISKAHLREISDLAIQLSENTFLYDVHIQIIDLLHQGLIFHANQQNDDGTFKDPLEFDLLPDLRQAREAMNSRYPVGERLWIDWLRDEGMLAHSLEDRIAVMELCEKAVLDEASSPKIWRVYGDWMWYLFKSAHGMTSPYNDNEFDEIESVVGRTTANRIWTEEDQNIGKEVFGWDGTMEVWRRGVSATEWHINQSHLVWNPYVQIVTHDPSGRPSSEKLQHGKLLFVERLQQPHAKWDDTFQMFSQFMSAHDDTAYEAIMVSVNQKATKAKQEYNIRQEYEMKLEQAAKIGDNEAEWRFMNEYLAWEFSQSRKKHATTFSLQLLNALSERANLRFPTDVDMWENHVDLITDTLNGTDTLLSVSSRATRHCPWSGALWSRRLYALEAASKEFSDLADVKHQATSTGLLEEVGGIEELIKINVAWCGFLRRRAFQATSSDDEVDVAAMGIISAIENVDKTGEKKYGTEFKGDPQFRLEKIYLNFLTQMKSFEEARDFWQKLSVAHGDQYEYWNTYYVWEMTLWCGEVGHRATDKRLLPPPEYATKVLQTAVRRPNLDWPEKMLEIYINHCAQHETVQVLQEAHVEARRVSKMVASRRAKEMAEVAVTSQSASEPQASLAIIQDHAGSSTGKRKRVDDLPTANGGASKKTRADKDNLESSGFGDAPLSAIAQLKRDRENTTVVVRGLPLHSTEDRIRSFFNDCGDILNVKLVDEHGDNTVTATIEFESKEDVLTAQTKSMKTFDGNLIDIQVETGTTLWVTNYPPEADESYMRTLFRNFDGIVEVRFPSLKYNTHRRFCYVQFLTSSQARAATQLDGKVLAGNLKLNVKISDPTAKKERVGATHEGREVYVGNLHYSTSEDDLKEMFRQFGVVEQVRIPRNMMGKSKGAAFVVYSSKVEASAALDMNLKEFKGRVLKVSIAVADIKGTKRQATIAFPSEPTSTLGASADIMDIPTGTGDLQDARSDHYSRTLTLLEVPDTVNDARIRALVAPYGKLRKVTLKPDHGAATVEFENEAAVGRARLALDGYEVAKGHFLRLGKITDTLVRKQGDKKGAQYEKREAPAERQDQQKKSKEIENPLGLLHERPVRRPGQSGIRTGRRGGLGYVSATRNSLENEERTSTNSSLDTKLLNDKVAFGRAAGKSQDEFRAMLEGK